MRLRTALFVLSPLMMACDGLFSTDPQTQPNASESQVRDIETFNALTVALEVDRERVLPAGTHTRQVAGDRLFWLDGQTQPPALHSLDAASGKRLRYTFPVGDGDWFVYSASTTLIATVERTSQSLRYRAFAADAPETLLGELAVSEPGSEARWWPFQATGEAVYLVEQHDGQHWLVRWVPGEDPEDLASLDELTGTLIRGVEDFAVHGEAVVLLEGGRVWHLDLAQGTAQWLENAKEVRTGSLSESGVAFAEGGTIRFLRFTTGELEDLSATISEAFELNPTFSSAHVPAGDDFTLWRDRLIYRANLGIFSYGLDTGVVTPILLEPRPEISDGVRVDYRRPRVSDAGLLYVIGLESTSGAVGSTGPVYRVDIGPRAP